MTVLKFAVMPARFGEPLDRYLAAFGVLEQAMVVRQYPDGHVFIREGESGTYIRTNCWM